MVDTLEPVTNTFLWFQGFLDRVFDDSLEFDRPYPLFLHDLDDFRSEAFGHQNFDSFAREEVERRNTGVRCILVRIGDRLYQAALGVEEKKKGTASGLGADRIRDEFTGRGNGNYSRAAWLGENKTRRCQKQNGKTRKGEFLQSAFSFQDATSGGRRVECYTTPAGRF